MTYLELNKAYYIEFRPTYANMNDVYLVTQKITYTELIKNGIDITGRFFDKIVPTTGVPTWDDFAQDTIDGVKAIDDTYYRLERPSEELENEYIWAPASTFINYPDSDIGHYKKLMLTLDLGIWDDKDKLTAAIDTIENVLHSNLGIQPGVVVSQYDKIWLKTSAYQTDIVDARAAEAGRAINHYSSLVTTLDALSKANNRITALETLVAELST